MSIKELIIKEIEHLPDYLTSDVLNYIRYLNEKSKQEKTNLALISESALKKDWLRPEEEAAWSDL